MKDDTPLVGITMGDPTGIGPEITLMALQHESVYQMCRPVVFGDFNILDNLNRVFNLPFVLQQIEQPEQGRFRPGFINVVSLSDLNPETVHWGDPTPSTGRAMILYIEKAVESALAGHIHAMVTGPINKTAMKMAGSQFTGHTELLAHKTNSRDYVMMMAGNRLKVVLVTIHQSLMQAILSLSVENIKKTICITHSSLQTRFGISAPRIAVAGLNPHAGEQGLFGSEEQEIVLPAIEAAQKRGWNISGLFPPDTVFYQAANGRYDAVVCMYHDQGLIPFKLLHFTDGVNTTLGLPIIRTSVDHGTAYEIAGTGSADTGSMLEAIRMAASQAGNAQKGSGFNAV
jgi:4-hydroxythreonine-4-phosphate dehydrogenase